MDLVATQTLRINLEKFLLEMKQSLSFKDKYFRQTQLGQGTFGTVYLAICKQTGRRIAWKTFHQTDFTSEGLDSTTLREVTITKALRHPNIRQVIDIHYEPSKLEVALEYVALDLDKYLKSKGLLPMRLIKLIIYQLLSSVAYIHSKQIIHRDIKPANVFIEENDYPVVKLGDFGNSRTLNFYNTPQYSAHVGTDSYKAPELLLGSRDYTAAVDEWSVGCIFGELLVGKILFLGCNRGDVLIKIFQLLNASNNFTKRFDEMLRNTVTSLDDLQRFFGTRNRSAKEHSEEAYLLKRFDEGSEWDKMGRDLLGKLLKFEPNNRILAHHALTHPFFNDLDVSLCINKGIDNDRLNDNNTTMFNGKN